MVPWQVTERARPVRVPAREAVGPGELPCPAPRSVPSAAGPQRRLPAPSSHLPHFLGYLWSKVVLQTGNNENSLQEPSGEGNGSKPVWPSFLRPRGCSVRPLYAGGGGEQGPFHLPGGAPRKPELRNAGKLPDRELRVSSDFCVVFIVWLHCI